jgi:hypothetical protein
MAGGADSGGEATPEGSGFVRRWWPTAAFSFGAALCSFGYVAVAGDGGAGLWGYAAATSLLAAASFVGHQLLTRRVGRVTAAAAVCVGWFALGSVAAAVSSPCAVVERPRCGPADVASAGLSSMLVPATIVSAWWLARASVALWRWGAQASRQVVGRAWMPLVSRRSRNTTDATSDTPAKNAAGSNAAGKKTPAKKGAVKKASGKKTATKKTTTKKTAPDGAANTARTESE